MWLEEGSGADGRNRGAVAPCNTYNNTPSPPLNLTITGAHLTTRVNGSNMHTQSLLRIRLYSYKSPSIQ